MLQRSIGHDHRLVVSSRLAMIWIPRLVQIEATNLANFTVSEIVHVIALKTHLMSSQIFRSVNVQSR